MSGWLYLKVERDDIELCHTFHPDRTMMGKSKEFTRADLDRELAVFIKKAYALFDFTDQIKEGSDV